MSAPANAPWLLFEHTDGRHAVCRAGEQNFTDGDPGWRRNGPVTVYGVDGTLSQDQIAIDSERLDIALRASHAIEATVVVMQTFVESERFETEPHFLRDALRGIWLRVRSLNSVVMSVTGDDVGRQTHEMNDVVYGRSLPARQDATP